MELGLGSLFLSEALFAVAIAIYPHSVLYSLLCSQRHMRS